MDEQTKKEITGYLKSLPIEVQKFVLDKKWTPKVREIAQKYSLTEEQSNVLENEVLFVIIGLTQSEDLLETFISELSISQILASQILEDLDNRVFEYVVKITEKKEVMEDKKNSPSTSQELEIAPTTLPAIEPGQTAHTTPAFSVPPKPITQNISSSETKISVPRYIAPADDEPSSPSAPAGTVPHNLPGQEVAPEKKYVADPYREPLN